MEDDSHSFYCLCGRELLVNPLWIGKLYCCSLCRKFGVIPSEPYAKASPPVFACSTERLLIRLAQKRDSEAIFAIHSDPLNYQFEISEPSDVRKVKSDIKESHIPKGFRKSHTLLFLAEDKAKEQVLGTLRLQFTQPYHSAMIGFMFAQQHQGKGYASEALSELSQLLLNSFGLEKLTAHCDSNNLACQAVLEKSGFQKEGFIRKFFHHPSRGWLDAPSYALFPEEQGDSNEQADSALS